MHRIATKLIQKKSQIHVYAYGIKQQHALQEENFHWNLDFAISLMANSLKFKFCLLFNY